MIFLLLLVYSKLYNIKNKEIKNKLNIFAPNEKIDESRHKWKEHLERMDDRRY